MTTSTQISNCESIKELKKQLKRGKRKLSARDAFQLPRTLRMLVRQDALELEMRGEYDAVISLYTQLSEGLHHLTAKVPRIYQPLIESSAKFWQSEAEKVKTKKITRPKTDSIASIIRPQRSSTATSATSHNDSQRIVKPTSAPRPDEDQNNSADKARRRRIKRVKSGKRTVREAIVKPISLSLSSPSKRRI